MKTMMIYNNPFNWFNPLFGLSMFEPLVYQNPVEESVSETPFRYKIEYTIPGMKKRDLKMRVDNGNLVLEGHHKESDFRLFKKNRSLAVSSFLRTTALSEDMDIDKLRAKFKDGVLTVDIPKKQEYINYREIPVNGTDAEIEEAKVMRKKSSPSVMEAAKQKLRSVFCKAA